MDEPSGVRRAFIAVEEVWKVGAFQRDHVCSRLSLRGRRVT